MKKILISSLLLSSILLTSYFLLLTSVSAHVAGQPPFFTINGKLSGYYQVPLTTDKIQVPLDSSPEKYLVNQTLTFRVEPTLLPINQSQLSEIEFQWDFGDGTQGNGLTNTHRYAKPGSYILSVHFKEQNQEARLIQATHIDVLPAIDYQTPTTVISVNGNKIKDPLIDVTYVDFAGEVTFSADLTQEGSSEIKSYQWVLNNEEVKTESTVPHIFDTTKQLAFVILRITTKDGFFHDAWVQLTNTNFESDITSENQTDNIITRTMNDISKRSTSFIQQGFNISSNPLLFIGAILFIFIAGGLHAITPGHGKSLLSIYLLGKKKGTIWDILLITTSITATHTIAIFILGFLFLALESTVSITEVMPYFEKVSAVVVAILAFNLIRNGYQNWRHERAHQTGIGHHHEHKHTHDHIKIHSKKDLLLIGVGGGILPCIDAFALLALSVSAGKTLLGIFFVLVFSIGLASTITLLGLLLIAGKDKLNLEERFGKTAEIYGPLVSGSIILLIALRLLL